MARKTPYRHHVGMHKRNGKIVDSYMRGLGAKPQKKPKLSTGYLGTGFFTHGPGGSDTLTKKAAELAKQNEVILEVNLPSNVDSMESERDFMWNNYSIDIGTDEDDDESFENLYYNADLRSFMGHRLEDGVYVIFPKYYVLGYEKYWNALIKNSTVHKEW